MKKIIPFKKDIPFNTKVSEITSISLEHTLKPERNDLIAGDFIISGEYKITDVSLNQEVFKEVIPFSINLDDRYNVDKIKVDIDDFYYEIINDEALRVNIDVLVDGIELMPELKVEKIEIEPTEELIFARGENDMEEALDDTVRDDMDLFKEIETPPTPVMSQTITEEKLKSLFDNFDEKDETFTTYHIHIVREEDSVDTIVTKYNTTKEELTLYNKMDELKIGDKIIIPAHKNE